jgi:IS605 OrfB family transposase
MLISKKIKLDVSEQDAATLEFMQGKCRALYNWWVMKLRSGEKWPGWKAAKKTLQESREYDPELNGVYGKLLHEVYFRLDGAMQAFFRRVQNGEKPGFPRVRPRHCFFTLIYPAMYIKVEGRSVTLPRYNRQLDKIRSKRDKCKKGSRRYKHLSQVYKRVSQQKRNKQQDCLHKASHLIAHTLVERTVVIGDLSQRQMVMNEHQERNKYRNRAVFNDWGLYTFMQMLLYKCFLYGKELVILDERDTSKTCCRCGHKQDMPLWKRTYRCPNIECRLSLDHDENSAVNILKRYLARLGPHMERISMRCADVFTAIDDVLNTFEHI